MPIPLSVIRNSTTNSLDPISDSNTRTDTRLLRDCPLENLIALLIRLISTCLSFSASPKTSSGISGSMKRSNSTSFLTARLSNVPQAFSITSMTDIGSRSISNLSASILEKSRISSMISSSAKADSRMRSSISLWLPVRLLCCSTSAMPITPFIGVLIS